MSDITLGLDIGSNSIGWSLVDEKQGMIMLSGVRVFPEGVDRDKQGGEKSKTAQRRTSRGMRRQIARRARRKIQLRKLLIRNDLLPKPPDKLAEVLSLNPYPLRARGIDEKLTLWEIGRVFIHLNQRRGFLSNRKADKARLKENEGMLAEISTLDKTIKQDGFRTLGQYLHHIGQNFDHKQRKAEPTDKEKKQGHLQDTVRHLHTRRSMYIEEFEAIWEAQHKHYPDILTGELKRKLYNPESDHNWVCKGMIFGQRKMWWPKSVVGRCELEPKQKRCPKADRVAQRFRILQEVNNARITDTLNRVERDLTADERSTLINYLSDTKEQTFVNIRKKLDFSEHVRFNYERAERKKLKGHETDAKLGSRKVLGKRWRSFPKEIKDTIVDILIHEDQEDVALQRLMDEGQLSKEDAEHALSVDLPDGYMSYSRVAIDRLIPHLERGLFLMADDASNSALHAAGYLRPDEREVRQREFLPPAPDLPNPLVRQAIVEVRKLVNAIIREYGRPDNIHVELAREAKKSLEERTQIRFNNARQRDRREKISTEIEARGIKPTRASINRYLLWQEQGEDCIYCGNKISQAQLFGEEGEVNVDHILPRWRSLDNSMANKVVCHRNCNHEKGDRTPREWLEDSDPDRYERVLQMANKLPHNKRRKFIQKDIILDDFVNRQLKDTQYITRLVTQYLKCLGAKIVTIRGQMTADLRHYWGLNILDPEGWGRKNRDDHRHHAIDAVVIALTNHNRMRALANHRGKDVKLPWPSLRDDLIHTIDEIVVSHRVQRRLYGKLHKDKLYGKAHEYRGLFTIQKNIRELKPSNLKPPKKNIKNNSITWSIEGKGQSWVIREPSLCNSISECLKNHGINPKIFTEKEIKELTNPQDYKLKLPSGVPIYKVTALRTITNPIEIDGNDGVKRYYIGGNNHHFEILEDTQSGKWSGHCVNMFTAAKRIRPKRGEEKLPLIIGNQFEQLRNEDKLPIELIPVYAGKKFIMSLSIGETVYLQHPKTKIPGYYVVIKLDAKHVYFKNNSDARPATEKDGIPKREEIKLSPQQLQKLSPDHEEPPYKVTIDPLGRIRYAND